MTPESAPSRLRDRLRRLPPAVFLLAAAGVAWGLLAALLGHRFAGHTVDDFYITYRYAQNLAAGHGFVFNPGERVFGTTAPGWGLVLGAARWVTGISAARLATYGTGASLLATALVLLWENRARRAECLVAGTLLVVSPYFWVMNGSELGPALALLAAAAALGRRAPATAGVLAGIAVWCRPDAAVAAGLLAVLLAWEGKRPPWRLPWRPLWRYTAVVALVVAAGLGLGWLWFGSPLPVTLEAKRIQGAGLFPGWKSGLGFWKEAFHHWRLFYVDRALVSFVAAGLAGQVPLLRRGGRAVRLVSLFGLALAVAYPLLGVPFYPWYTLAPQLSLLLGATFLVGSGVRSLPRLSGGRRAAGAVTAAAIVAVVVWLGSPLDARRLTTYAFTMPLGSPVDLYRRTGAWLAEHTAPSDEVAYVEVGALAYYSRRPVRDLLGLVSPASLPFVARRDMVGAFLVHPTPLVVYDTRLHGFIQPLRDQPWFARRYEEVARFRAAATGELLVVYRLRPGEALPAPP